MFLFFRPQNGYCQPYRGMTCSTFIGNNSIYVTDYLEQSTIEERLTSAFLVIADDLSPQCQEYAIPSLCYFAFPFCDTTAKEPRGRDLCRDECEILEQDICEREYKIAKDYPGVVLPECSLLPQIGTKESETCVRIGIPATKGINGEYRCIMGLRISRSSYRVLLTYFRVFQIAAVPLSYVSTQRPVFSTGFLLNV